MGTFRQCQLEEQITLAKVVESYGKLPIKINEVFTEKDGWFKPVGLSASKRDIWQMAMSGATHFNFEITDEWGQTKYPDFSLKELVRD